MHQSAYFPWQLFADPPPSALVPPPPSVFPPPLLPLLLPQCLPPHLIKLVQLYRESQFQALLVLFQPWLTCHIKTEGKSSGKIITLPTPPTVAIAQAHARPPALHNQTGILGHRRRPHCLPQLFSFIDHKPLLHLKLNKKQQQRGIKTKGQEYLFLFDQFCDFGLRCGQDPCERVVPSERFTRRFKVHDKSVTDFSTRECCCARTC